MGSGHSLSASIAAQLVMQAARGPQPSETVRSQSSAQGSAVPTLAPATSSAGALAEPCLSGDAGCTVLCAA